MLQNLPLFLQALPHLRILFISLQILPLENEMRNPEDFGWVLNLGMGIVTTLFISMGMFGYLAYGTALKGSVTLNLPDFWYVFMF